MRREARSLPGALYYHAAAVEACLAEAGQQPGIAYSAVDVVRIAATLVAASLDANGEPRWPEPNYYTDDSEESPGGNHPSDPDDPELPF
jgi:hypothetical protein